MPFDRKILQDYVATANSGKYKTWEEINSKFPELKDFDAKVLQDYVATANSGKYKSYEEIDSKFPEFDSVESPKKKVSSQPFMGNAPFSKQGVGAGVKLTQNNISDSPLEPTPATIPSESIEVKSPKGTEVDLALLNKNKFPMGEAFQGSPEEFTKTLEEGSKNAAVITEQKKQIKDNYAYQKLKTRKESLDRGFKDTPTQTAEEQMFEERKPYLIQKLNDYDKTEVQSMQKYKDLKAQGKEKEANEQLKIYLDTRSQMREEANQTIQDLQQEKADMIKSIETELGVDASYDYTQLSEIREIDQRIKDVQESTKPFFDPKMDMAQFIVDNNSAINEVSRPTETAEARLAKYVNAQYTKVQDLRAEYGLDRAFDNPIEQHLATEIAISNYGREAIDELNNEEFKLRNASKLLFLNRTPLQDESAFGVFGNKFVTTLVPMLSSKMGTNQAIAQNLAEVVNGSEIDAAVNEKQKERYDREGKDYNAYTPKWWAANTAPTAAIVPEMIAASVLTEGLFGGTKAWQALGALAEGGTAGKAAASLLPIVQKAYSTKVGRGLIKALASGTKFGAESEALATIFPHEADQMNFMTGMFGGTMGSLASQGTRKLMGTGYSLLTRMFGNKSNDAARIIANMGQMRTQLGQGIDNTIGEYFEESGENLVNMYKQSDTYDKFIKQVTDHYGDLDAVTQEAVAILSMGFGAPAGSAIGRTMSGIGKDMYNKLDVKQRRTVDRILNDITSELEVVQNNIAGEEVELKTPNPKSKVEGLEALSTRIDNAEYINEKELEPVLDGLYSELDAVDNDEDMTPEQRNNYIDLLEDQINKIEGYEFTTTTKAGKVTKRQAVLVPNETRRANQKQPFEFLEGGTAEITSPDGSVRSGTITTLGGEIVLQVPNGPQIVIGREELANRDLVLDEEEGIQLDPDTGLPSSVTLVLGESLAKDKVEPNKDVVYNEGEKVWEVGNNGIAVKKKTVGSNKGEFILTTPSGEFVFKSFDEAVQAANSEIDNTSSKSKIRVTSPEHALDLAIQIRQQEIPSVVDDADFDIAYEEFTDDVEAEVLKSTGEVVTPNIDQKVVDAWEGILAEESVKDKPSQSKESQDAKAKIEAIRSKVDPKSLKEAKEITKHLDAIKQQLLDAGVISTIDCSW